MRIDSTNSVYSPRASPTNVLDVQSAEIKKMSRKVLFSMSFFSNESYFDDLKTIRKFSSCG